MHTSPYYKIMTAIFSCFLLLHAIMLNKYILFFFSGLASEYSQKLPHANERSIYFFPCPDSEYYTEHGVDVLYSETLNDYLAAKSIQSSSVCFKITPGAKFLRDIEITWYDTKTAPSQIQLSILNTLGMTTTSLTTDVKVHHLNEFATSNIKIPKQLSSYYFRLSTSDVEIPQRLLLRAITPFFFSDPSSQEDAIWHEAQEVALLKPYGVGTATVEYDDPKRLQEIINSTPTWQCDNFSAAFWLRNRNHWPMSVVKLLQKRTGAIHVIIQLVYNNRRLVIDPTLGFVYTCSLEDLLQGVCNRYSYVPSDSISPAMYQYFGNNFFTDAIILETHANFPVKTPIF